MYFTSQPLERSNLDLTEATFKAIKAETQLAVCVGLAALGFRPAELDHDAAVSRRAQAKRNILGFNAARLFNLEVPKHKLIKPTRTSPRQRRRRFACRSRPDMPKVRKIVTPESGEAPRKGRPAAPRHGASGDFCAAAREALQRGEPDAISDQDVCSRF